MSILSRIASFFAGRGTPDSAAKPAAEPQSYRDCVIHAEPIREGSQYRLAGRIEKDVDGQVLERIFIRADQFSSLDDALDCTFRKAQQIIDQNGPGLFSDGESKRNV